MAIGCERPPPSTDSADSTSLPWFEEVASERGLDFVHDSGHKQRYLMPEIMAGGAALFDMDGDGDLDAYLVQSGGLEIEARSRPSNQLYRNRGEGHFENVTVGSGADDRGDGTGVAAGDFDNDGLVDLYVTNMGPNVLLHNRGDGRFIDVTESAGVGDPSWSSSAAFLDYDSDGDLDLYVANYVRWSMDRELDCYGPIGERDYCGPTNYQASAADTLYRNDGNGSFTDVSKAAGLRAAFGNGLGVLAGDFTDDGLTDIFVANDQNPDQLWVNQGDGTFRDLALQLGCALDLDGIAKAGMGVAAADIDNDSDLDLLVVNLAGQTDSFFRNDGNYLTDRTLVMGLGVVSRPFTRFGVGLLDFDNDGRLDLFEASGRVERHSPLYANDPYAEPNVLFRGTAGGRFEEVQPRGGTKPELLATGRAAAFGDIDNDGGIDILVVNRDGPVHLLRNTVQDRGHWIQFRVLEASGRDALGASVMLSVDNTQLRRDARSAYSYLAANDARVHFGLGDHRSVDDVQVRWPDNEVENFGHFEADGIIELMRGTGHVQNETSVESPAGKPD
ncbi:MAG: CRTAC1 family protein [Gammaproteobacteria bacterium]|nr:CRTAC1 family protein [Gammaproteobacteria bacterium]